MCVLCLPRCSPNSYIKRITAPPLRHDPAAPPWIQGPCQAGTAGTWETERCVCSKVIMTTLITIRKICGCHRLLRYNIPFSALINWDINLPLLAYNNNSDLSKQKRPVWLKLIFFPLWSFRCNLPWVSHCNMEAHLQHNLIIGINYRTLSSFQTAPY